MKWACEIEEPLRRHLTGAGVTYVRSTFQSCVCLRISSFTGLHDFVSDIHTSPAFTLHIRHAIRFG